MKNLLIALSCLFVSSQALATGGIYCATETSKVVFELSTTNSRSYADAIVDGVINVQFKDTSVPANLKTIKLNHSDIKQFWKDGKALKLIAVRDNDELQNTVTQTIVELNTKWIERKYSFVGTVKINLDPYTKLAEKISCTVD
jgi:hypothetical protein